MRRNGSLATTVERLRYGTMVVSEVRKDDGLPTAKTMGVLLSRPTMGEGGGAAYHILSYKLHDDLLGTPQSEQLSWSAVIDGALQRRTEAPRLLRNSYIQMRRSEMKLFHRICL